VACARRWSNRSTISLHVRPSLTCTDLKAIGLKPALIYNKLLGCLLEVRLDRELSTNAEEGELVKQMATMRQGRAANYRGCFAGM